MAKEKTYTHEQVENLVSQAKANIGQLKQDVADREKEISELKSQVAQHEAEKQNLATRQTELDEKSAELDRREAALLPEESALTEQKKSLAEKQGELEAREIALASQEKAFSAIKEQLVKASEELAAQKAELFAEAEKLASGLHGKRIAETEAEIQKMRESAAKEREAFLAAARQEAEAKRSDAQKECETLLAQAKRQFDDTLSAASEQAEKIRADARAESERIITSANEEAQKIIDRAASDTQNLENQISELTANNAKLSGENTKLAAENAQLSEDKRNLSNLLAERKSEFDTTTATYAKTMSSFETLKVQLAENGKSVELFTKEIAGMDTREQGLNARENELNERDRKLSFNEKRNEHKTAELEEKEANIDGEVEARYPEIIADKNREIDALKKETESLRNSLFANTSIITKFDDLTAQFGGKNPAEVLQDYQRIQQELALAMEKVNNTPSYALQKKAADLHDKENALAERENALTQKERESQQFHDDYVQKQAEVSELTLKNETLAKDLTIVKEQLDRLRSTYENPAERDERVKAINVPLIKESRERADASHLTELSWLGGIEKRIDEYGLHFPRRILHAFHTALKSSEMAPLTVLAGVSGTGKSELPRLYSRFGGINFLGVPVQPNWDCQEAMLGYYNSIDNCFGATDVLRLLAQSQRNSDDQNGMNDVMTMILLDEMNLANVELYFAEFLSKLETRRGLSDRDVPYLGVKIGSKMDDWQLKLGRNILWTGTMNNDETTKTLSDKVLDRGIVINFPRPKTFIRSQNNVLGGPAPLLPRTIWDSWIRGKHGAYQFSDEHIRDYKEKVEQINEQLGKTGRALGHRVWQSIESYMSLYPDVIAAQSDKDRIAAMDKAFEDQLVQKVMPKLRGIETRGEQGEALDAIEARIPETLREDFANAKQGYGQFMWTTSGYLLRGDSSSEQPETSATENDSVPEVHSDAAPDYEAIKTAVKALLDNGDIKDSKAYIPEYLMKEWHIEDKKERTALFKKLKKDLQF